VNKLADLKRYGGIAFSGLLLQYAPDIMKGALAEAVKNVTVAEASKWVAEDKYFWDNISPKYRQIMHQYSSRLGKAEWFTTEWIIDCIATSNPALASLFLGWKKGHNWLERQVNMLRRELGKEEIK